MFVSQNLKQTKGYANFRGVISGLHNRRSGSSKTEMDWGTKLLFFIKTSEHNSIPVELIQFKSQIGRPVYISNRDEDGKIETKPVEWSQRNQKFDGWQLIGTSVRSKNHEEVSNLVPIDAIEYILDNFEDGDSVFVNCDITRSESGDKKYTNYTIKRIYATNEPIDFEAEDFEEITDFREEFVYNEFFVNKKDNKAFVSGNVINYGDKVVPVVYTVELKTDDDKAIVDYLEKNSSYGDVLTVEGIIHNRVIGEWIENETTQRVVGRGRQSFQRPERTFIIKGEKKEFQILSIADVKKGLYTKSEFEAVDDDTPDWLK